MEKTKAQEIADEEAGSIEELKEAVKKSIEVKTDMTLEQFYNECKRLNDIGREATLKHKELYPAPGPDNKPKTKGGRRHHEPGTQIECAHCKPVIKSWEDYQKLLAEQIGMTGVPLDGLFSAIKITRATIKMMKNGGEI